MQSDQRFFRKNALLPLANQVGNSYMHIPVASAVGAVLNSNAKHLTPFHGVEFQPSEVCPKNFIIFDKTDRRSQVMFHPAIAHKFNSPGIDIHATYAEDNFEAKEVDHMEREISSPFKEDSDDINALLSFEEDEQEEEDDDEVSTARTNGDYGVASPDSFSNYGSKPKKNRYSSSIQESSGSDESYNNERKRQKMKKMVRALRGMLPGGNQMNTVAVLDESVKYLKSLKFEVQKLGVGDLKNSP